MLIDSAVRAVKGDLSDKKGMVAAMRKADFKSTRGKFKYNINHFPIENFYLLKAVKGAGGEVEMQIQKTIFENHKDSYYQELHDEVVAAGTSGARTAPFFLTRLHPRRRAGRSTACSSA